MTYSFVDIQKVSLYSFITWKFELYRCYRMISFIIFIYKPLIISTVTPI